MVAGFYNTLYPYEYTNPARIRPELHWWRSSRYVIVIVQDQPVSRDLSIDVIRNDMGI